MKLPFQLTIAIALFANGSFASANCDSKADYWPFDYETGNDDISAEFFADLHVIRDCKTLRSEIHAGAVGDLYGISTEVVDAIAGASLEDHHLFSIDAEVAVLGMVVQDFRYDKITELGYRDSFTFPVQISDRQTFMVGPVPVAVEYGIIGEAGLNYNAALQIGALNVGAHPFTQSSVFAATGVDIGFASVKAKGDVILINDNLDTEMTLAIDQVNFDKLVFNAYGNNELTALDGKILVEAEAHVAGIKKNYEKELFSWDGYFREDEAFRVELDIPFN